MLPKLIHHIIMSLPQFLNVSTDRFNSDYYNIGLFIYLFSLWGWGGGQGNCVTSVTSLNVQRLEYVDRVYEIYNFVHKDW